MWTTATASSSRGGSQGNRFIRKRGKSFLYREGEQFSQFGKLANRTLTSAGMKWSMLDPNPIISPDMDARRLSTPYGPALTMNNELDWKKYSNFENIHPHATFKNSQK